MAIIPARGGSKGLPGKNIKPLCGKPLINYTIEAALKSGLIDHVMVSTDDEEIAAVARKAGADVPFLRPAEYARDNSSVKDAVSFTLEQLSQIGIQPEIVAILYPTHPFRPPGLLDFLVRKNLSGYSPVSTVKKISHKTRIPLFLDANGRLKPLAPINPDKSPQRSTFVRDYGLFFGINLTGGSAPYVHSVEDPVALIDIDTLKDFYLAEEVVKRNLFQF